MVRRRTRGGFAGLVLAAIACLATVPPAEADIGRANLDGSSVDPSFIATRPLPSGVAVDGEYVYWSGNYHDGDAGVIGRANLDGSGVDPSFIAAPYPTGVAVDGGHVYWSSEIAIGRASLDGSGVDPSFIDVHYATAVAINAEHIYWTAFDDLAKGTAIGRANLDGSEVDPYFIDPNGAGGLALDDGHIYWSSRGTIARANLDGSGQDPNFIDSGGASGVAVDGEHIYWSNDHGGTIGRANLDGSAVDPKFITDARCATAVAVDGEYIYWSHDGDCSDDTVTVTVKRKRLTLEGRHVAVKLAVPASEASPPVSGTLRLKTRKRIRYRGERRRVTLAEAPVKVWAAPGARSVVLRLKSKARLIRDKRRARKVRAIAEVSDYAGNETRVAKRMRLRASG